MSAARTATANWAGFMSLLPKIVSDTKRAGSSWREPWFERARASKSTSLQTTHEPLDQIISPPLSHLLCTARHHLQTLRSVKSWLHPSPLPHLWFMTIGLCWVEDCFVGYVLTEKTKVLIKCHREYPPQKKNKKQLGTCIWSWKIHLCKC